MGKGGGNNNNNKRPLAAIAITAAAEAASILSLSHGRVKESRTTTAGCHQAQTSRAGDKKNNQRERRGERYPSRRQAKWPESKHGSVPLPIFFTLSSVLEGSFSYMISPMVYTYVIVPAYAHVKGKHNQERHPSFLPARHLVCLSVCLSVWSLITCSCCLTHWQCRCGCYFVYPMV